MEHKDVELTNQIIDTAIALAEKNGWESVRLNQVAKTLGITLDKVREIFREKEDIIDAWFDRADSSMLKTPQTAEFEALETSRKLHILLMNWLAVLSAHRRVTRQMIVGKLEPGHIHYQLKGLLRISRTVQWWRDAAGISSTLPKRAVDEAALTAIYLASFVKWMFDSSENSRATSELLKRRLDQAAIVLDLFNTNRKKHATRPSPQASL